MNNMPRGVYLIIVVNVILFLAQEIAPQIQSYFVLNYYLVIHDFQFWRIFSYMFFHDGFLHILLNMYILFMVGSELENTWGKRSFLNFYLVTGVISGIFILIGDYINYSSGVVTGTLGASGAISACFLIYALYYPSRQILLFFIIPTTMRKIVLFFFFFSLIGVIIQWLSVLFSGQNTSRISHMGHLGGYLGAIMYIKWMKSRSYDFAYCNTSLNGEVRLILEKVGFKKKSWSTEKGFFERVFSKKKEEEKSQKVEEDSLNEKTMDNLEIENKIDELLDNISRGGLKSLSLEEQMFLDRVSKNYKYKFPKG